MAQFNLGELIKQGKVPNLGTTQNQEQIEYIALDLIDDDPRNFYELSGLDELAANIELLGLQQPIRVRSNPENPGRVIIVSGHRRRAAIRKLAEEAPEKWQKVPCIREQGEVSPALQELRLIYANSDTRKMSSADQAKQAERVEALLYQLKEEGYEFPGRMRDHVAQACQISKSKLARLKVIREKLSQEWQPFYEKGELKESTAYALAQQPAEHQKKIYLAQMNKSSSLSGFYENAVEVCSNWLQKISEITCKKCGGASCQNQDGKWEHIVGKPYYYGNCHSICCDKCADLGSCKYSCPLLAEKAKKLKADKREAKRQEKLAQEAKDVPKIHLLESLWIRFGVARTDAGKSVKEFKEALGSYYSSRDEKEFEENEGAWKNSAVTHLPYGYSFGYDEARRLIAAADLLGCSLDYLFCRTDEPNPVLQNCREPAETLPDCSEEHISMNWHPASEWPEDGTVAVVVRDWKEYKGVPDFDITVGIYKGGQWLEFGCEYLDIDDVHKWLPIGDPVSEEPPTPDVCRMVAGMDLADPDSGPSGQLVFSGWMPGGTTPSAPCDVVAVFDLGDGFGNKKTLARWNGQDFLFAKGGAKIEMPVVKWMALPPDEEGT